MRKIVVGFIVFANVVIVNAGQRIISLAPSITESLFLLGIDKDIVGVTTYCEYPEKAKSIEKIGSLLSVDLEKIVKLKPTIVIGAGINRMENLEKIRKLGFNVKLFERESSFKDICADFVELGKAVGKEKEAIDIVDTSKIELGKIQKKIISANLTEISKIFWECGNNPIVTVTGGTFVNDIISISGGINIAGEMSEKYVRYSKEEVIRQNPDIIVIVGMGIESNTEKKMWQQYKKLSAVKKNRIYIIEDAHAVSAPNPVTFTQAVNQVARLFHPKLFK